eukprot:TRINITY_DN10026_c0_g1_i5.p1 TRINITY_DN10026_c0_g1~~TRINITY_DN10026_c0_g1_i5.p1  ORF type:complete len:509 (-),score=129.80 TRINITY_DN10026_c0_g1_i5:54-1580(-)
MCIRDSNEFISYEIPLKYLLTGVDSKVPVLAHRSKLGEVWHFYDTSFCMPKTMVRIKIMTDDCGYGATMEGLVFASLYEMIVIDALSEVLYMGKLAGASFSINFSETVNYGTIAINSFSAIMIPFVKKVFKMLSELSAESLESIFQKQHEKYMKVLGSFDLSPPDEQMLMHFRNLCFTNSFLPSQLLPLASTFTFKAFLSLYVQWLQHAHYILYAHGTLSEADAVELSRVVEGTLFKSSVSVCLESLPSQRLMCISLQTPHVYIGDMKEKDEENSILFSYFQGEGKSELKDVAVLEVLMKYMEEKAFDVLRTQQQLGYDVSIAGSKKSEILGVTIFVESNRYCPEIIVRRVDDFLEKTLKELESIELKEFSKYIESAKASYLEKDVKLKDKCKRINSEVFRSEFVYDRKAKMIQEIDRVTKAQLLEFANNLFIKNMKRLDLEIVCDDHKKHNEVELKKNAKKYGERKVNRVRINSLEKFWEKAVYYADFGKERYTQFLNSLDKSTPST